MRTATTSRGSIPSSIKILQNNKGKYTIEIQCDSKIANKTVDFFNKQTRIKTRKAKSKQISKGTAVYGSDVLDYKTTVDKGLELIHKGGHLSNFGLFIVCGVNMGLRVSDLRKLTYKDLQACSFEITETKSRKGRRISVNNVVKYAIDLMLNGRGINPSMYAFISKKRRVYSPQRLNILLKEHLGEKNPNKLITTHSLRKTFARRYYDLNKHNPKVMEDLAVLLNHSSTAITRRYIGITKDEIDQVYHQVGADFVV